MTKTVLILGGSGKIGQHATRAFAKAGWRVRQFDRKRDNMMKAAQGVDVIVNGLNPPNYHNWDVLIPEITDAVIAAAKVNSATIILPGNVYNFGDQGGTWDENTPQKPVARKGRIRVTMEDTYRRSGVQTLVLRAGNFIDPERNGDVMSLVIMKDRKGRKISFPADPNTLQAYCWLPDWARAAVGLAEMRQSLAQFEDIPLGGLAFRATDLANAIAARTAKPVTVGGFPWLLFQVTAPVWELARELLDMRYLWSTDHALCDRKLRMLLPGFQVTALDTILDQLLDPQVNPNHSMPALV